MKLRARQQREIVNELGTTQSLRECLDVVEIAIGFLSSGKTDAKTKLEKYVKGVLRLEKKFTSKKVICKSLQTIIVVIFFLYRLWSIVL